MTPGERHKRWAARNKEHLKKYASEWRYKNQDKLRAYRRKHYKYNYEKSRTKQLWRKFGVTAVEYEAMRARQQDRCAICGTSKPGGKGDWHLDHDHTTKKVRGLLCQNCNIGLGNFQDSFALLVRATMYLTKHAQA